jgi:hypothetical protein
MKRCPQCNAIYDDDSLRFCLNDGSVLAIVADVSAQDPHATLPYGPAGLPLVDAPGTRRDQISLERDQQSEQARRSGYLRPLEKSESSNSMLTVGVIAIATSLLIIAGIAVIFLIKIQSSGQQSPQPGAAHGNGPSGSASPGSTRNTQSSNASDSGLPKLSGLEINPTASSVRYRVQGNTYDAANAIDNNEKTAWLEGADGGGAGEWLRFDFDREINLHKIFIKPGYFKSPGIWKQNNRVASATFYFSDGSSRSFNFPDLMERQTLDLGSIRTRWVRMQIDSVHLGSDPDTAVSEVVFEWEA